jgi:hypothetical protein
MSLTGPIVVVADHPAAELVEALASAGAFPIVESTWKKAPAAFISVQPAAIVLADPAPSAKIAAKLALHVETRAGPIVPVLARVAGDAPPCLPMALPFGADALLDRMIARLRFALRVRTLHAAVLRRMESLPNGLAVRLPDGDPLDDATVLVAGRGRGYPALSVAVGERVALLGALSVETAARHLNGRDLDGIVIGDGFGPRMVEAFLTVLSEDVRFRDLPVAVTVPCPVEDDLLPNLDRLAGDAPHVVERLLPLVRLHAFQSRLKRMLASLDSQGMIDPDSGLHAEAVFWNEWPRAVEEAKHRGAPLSLARFWFDPALDRRASLDAARLVSRLVRNVDFGCREADGSIVAVFTETDLGAAHVITRRIASVLKHTILAPDRDRHAHTPHITLATLKARDTAASLMARAIGGHAVAAE